MRVLTDLHRSLFQEAGVGAKGVGREEVVKVVQEALARGEEGTAERNAQVSPPIELARRI